jgi:hypothetical protein
MERPGNKATVPHPGQDDEPSQQRNRLGQTPPEIRRQDEEEAVTINIMPFGARAAAIKRNAQEIANDAHLVEVYVRDTAKAPGDGDYALLQSAQILEEAARDLRVLHERIAQVRTDRPARVLQAAE